MGVWGIDLFADDVACDVRDHYRELLEDGVEDEEATRQTLEKCFAYFEESEDIAVLALAVTQSKLGRLDPHIRDRALAVIDRGADLEVWEQDDPKLLPKRRAMLEKVRAQLTGQQPARKRLRRPKRITSGLAAGDVLALALPDRIALLRVVCAFAPAWRESSTRGARLPGHRSAVTGRARAASATNQGPNHLHARLVTGHPVLRIRHAAHRLAAGWLPESADNQCSRRRRGGAIAKFRHLVG